MTKLINPPKTVGRDHVLQAASEILREGVPTNRFSSLYSVNVEGQLLPPPYLMQRACELATGESYDPSSGLRFRAGRGTKMFEMFEGMGFAIEMVPQGAVCEVGAEITRKELGELLKEEHLAQSREGVYKCKGSNMYLLFVNLNKDSAKESLKFNDFFEGDMFHWDSQPKQSISVPSIQQIVKGERRTHLFARVYPKIGSQTQPYVYCGELEYHSYDPETANPVHLKFRALEMRFDIDQEHPLREIYDWRPGLSGGGSVYQVPVEPKAHPNRFREIGGEETERTASSTSRVGQDVFRHNQRVKWKDTCPVTGCKVAGILKASHIVPWKDATSEERLDTENGILLSPDVDALFDGHMISFEDDGRMVVGPSLKRSELTKLGIDSSVRITVTAGMKPYLKRHREALR